MPIETFREFPDKLKNLSHLKGKKLVMYCTGGIRCEKASAYLKQQGFKDVNQLEGGIINFVNQYPGTYFEGSCFVFDDRLTFQDGDPISSCKHCDNPCSKYINCHNLDCDKLFICCPKCEKGMKGACSEKCTKSKRQRRGTDNKQFN